MKIVKIVLGVLFALWALGTLPFCVSELMRSRSFAEGAANAGMSVSVVGVFSLFSIWSFQYAFKKPMEKREEDSSSVQS